MLVQDLIVIFILAMIGFIWWHDRGIKQKAYNLAKRKCDQIDVQLLDQNVRLDKIQLIRSKSTPLSIERTFKFEFTVTGERRYSGTLVMRGSRLHTVETEAHHIH